MATFVLRVWLPDRPGALGAVASRVGAVRGDVIGIDIIERGAGRAVDELVVDLPAEDLIDLLLTEIDQVEGVDVEDVRPLAGPPEDPAVLALRVAVALHGARGQERWDLLVTGARELLHADWAVLVDPHDGAVLASDGDDPPAPGWLAAFVGGALAEGATPEVAELAVASLGEVGPVLVVSREHLPLRGREREVLASLAHLG
ncbi:MAG: ACT domain-containing protein [Microthrixaceae bacterium]